MVFLSRVVYQAVLRRIEPARLVARQVVILHCFAERQACRHRYLQSNLVAGTPVAGIPVAGIPVAGIRWPASSILRQPVCRSAAHRISTQFTSAASAAGAP
ncbi:hypothetical protein [Paraburkholderia fungorum]|uniref:hypothetical protein n=1 Tax=Paraburkholderia fungorum TaxID=134537 RepID=UPI000A628D59|nr:hypothetical protein [Paraburkholderia fungorum]